MIAVMRDTEYWTKPTFIENFMSDWKKILGKNHIIQNFKDCNFDPIYEWHQREKEKKQMSTGGYIEGIRAAYSKNVSSKDVTNRQVAVATYIIDKLALRAGNEKVAEPLRAMAMGAPLEHARHLAQ